MKPHNNTLGGFLNLEVRKEGAHPSFSKGNDEKQKLCLEDSELEKSFNN